MIVGIAAAVAAFLLLVPSGCNDLGGASSWERCTTYLGTPAFSVEDFGWDASLNMITPIVVGLLFCFIAWGILGMFSTDDDAGGR